MYTVLFYIISIPIEPKKSCMSSLLQKLREKHLVKKEPKSQTNQLVASSDMREEDVMSHLWKALVMSALTMLTLLLFIMFPLIINFSNDFFFLIMLFYRNIIVYSFFYISRLIAAINRDVFSLIQMDAYISVWKFPHTNSRKRNGDEHGNRIWKPNRGLNFNTFTFYNVPITIKLLILRLTFFYTFFFIINTQCWLLFN